MEPLGKHCRLILSIFDTDLIEEIGELAAETGAHIEVVSTDSEEGSQLWHAFRGLGAILRYKIE